MKENIYSRSRRRTPWTDKASVTPLESFLDNHVAVEYGRRHPRISDTMESELLNTLSALQERDIQEIWLSADGIEAIPLS